MGTHAGEIRPKRYWWPPSVKRRKWALSTAVLLTALPLLLLVWIDYFLVFLVLIAVVNVVVQIMSSRWTSGALEHVENAGYLVCPRCEYILEYAPSTTRCPECGHQYDVDQLQNDWRVWTEWARRDRRLMITTLMYLLVLFTAAIVWLAIV